MIDLAPHLTNTSLQTHRGEDGVRLLDELVGCHILSGGDKDLELTAADVGCIIDQMAEILAETFRAALQNPIHFQVCSMLSSSYVGCNSDACSLNPTPSNSMVSISWLHIVHSTKTRGRHFNSNCWRSMPSLPSNLLVHDFLGSWKTFLLPWEKFVLTLSLRKKIDRQSRLGPLGPLVKLVMGCENVWRWRSEVPVDARHVRLHKNNAYI